MPRPEFMNKEPSDLTEEEIRLKLDFEKKEANFLEERAKLIKVINQINHYCTDTLTNNLMYIIHVHVHYTCT